MRKLFGPQFPQHRNIVAGLEARSGNKNTATDLVQGIFDFRDPIGRIDRNQNGANLRCRKLNYGPFGTIGCPNSDPVALLHAKSKQPCRNPVHFAIKVCP